MERKYGVDLKWLAVSSFEIKFGDTTVVTDPFITECKGTSLTYEDVEKCDIITLGHSHWDHVTDIPRLCKKFSPKVLCGDMTALPLAEWLNYTPAYIYPMHPNLELDFGDVKVLALFGKHKYQKNGMGYNDLVNLINENEYCQADEGMAKLQGVGTLEYRNYLFTAPNGAKVLIWGNDPTPEQKNICKALAPDIAILQRPVGEKAVLEMAKFAADIGCKVLIPHHHDFHGVDDPSVVEKFGEEFLSRVPDGKFISPVHGEWIEL